MTRMKSLLTEGIPVLAVVFCVACGGAGEDIGEVSHDIGELEIIDYPIPENERDDDETVEKATIFIPNGFGIAGDGTRCQLPTWAGSPPECKVPKHKHVCFNRISDTEAPPAAFASLFTGGLADAKADWIPYIQARGYSVIDSPECGGDELIGGVPVVTIKFANIVPLPGFIAFGKMTPSGSTADHSTTGAGKLKRWIVAAVSIDPSTIAGFSGWAGKTSTQRRRFIRNLCMHELMHAVGLGHAGGSSLLMTTDFQSDQTVFNTTLFPTSTESNLLTNFDD